MAASPVPLLQLGNGVTAPALAYGTGTAWFSSKEGPKDGTALVSSITSAISLGFRHLDCAEMYNNEEHVGLAIKASPIPRESLFITSKIYPSLSDPEAGLRASLARLNLSYLDLYLVHSPFKFSSAVELQRTWGVLERCVSLGLTRAIGVSNFRLQDIQSLLETAKMKPAVNQIEFHPYLQSPELRSFCSSSGILTESYGSLAPILGAAGGPLDPVLDKISSRHKKTKAQVLLRWALQKECMVVTTTSKVDRMSEYLGACGFELSGDDMLAIDEAGSKKEYRKFWTKEFPPPRL